MSSVKEKKKRVQYTHTTFKKAVREALQGSNSLVKVARDHGIPYTTLTKKVKQIKQGEAVQSGSRLISFNISYVLEDNFKYCDSRSEQENDDSDLDEEQEFNFEPETPQKLEDFQKLKDSPAEEAQEDQKFQMSDEVKEERQFDCCIACLQRSDELFTDQKAVEGFKAIVGNELVSSYVTLSPT